MSDKQGYEAMIHVGTAGSTATNLLENATDIDYDRSNERGSTTIRGDSSAPPIEYSRITSRKAMLTWKMVNKSTDSQLAVLLAAANAGTPVAIKYSDYSGSVRFDGDCNIDFKNGAPLKGEQTFEFSADPNKQNRVAVLS